MRLKDIESKIRHNHYSKHLKLLNQEACRGTTDFSRRHPAASEDVANLLLLRGLLRRRRPWTRRRRRPWLGLSPHRCRSTRSLLTVKMLHGVKFLSTSLEFSVILPMSFDAPEFS